MAAGRAQAVLLALLLAAAAPAPDARRPDPAGERLLAQQRVAAASRLHAAETAAADLAEQLVSLAGRQQAAEAALADRAAALAPLLPLAERLGLYPAETLLALPVPPDQAIQGLAVLGAAMRALEADARALRAEQDRLQALRDQTAATLDRLRRAQAEQGLLAAQLDRQIEAARALRPRVEDPAVETAKRAATEAARAETLRGALAAVRPPHPAAPAGLGIESGAVMPAAGPVVRQWGERTDAGAATGLSIRAPPLGRVVAPCGGTVAFAGPFRSYGKLVIVDCGRGYHVVLAGLDRLDVTPGAPVQAGEPVGVMPAWDPAAAGPHPALYLELRHEGQPINPAPFLFGRRAP